MSRLVASPGRRVDAETIRPRKSPPAMMSGPKAGALYHSLSVATGTIMTIETSRRVRPAIAAQLGHRLVEQADRVFVAFAHDVGRRGRGVRSCEVPDVDDDEAVWPAQRLIQMAVQRSPVGAQAEGRRRVRNQHVGRAPGAEALLVHGQQFGGAQPTCVGPGVGIGRSDRHAAYVCIERPVWRTRGGGRRSPEGASEQPERRVGQRALVGRLRPVERRRISGPAFGPFAHRLAEIVSAPPASVGAPHSAVCASTLPIAALSSSAQMAGVFSAEMSFHVR